MQAHGEVIVPLAIHAEAWLIRTKTSRWIGHEEGNAFWSDLSFQGNPLGRINHAQRKRGLFSVNGTRHLNPCWRHASGGLRSVVDYIAEDQELVVHPCDLVPRRRWSRALAL